MGQTGNAPLAGADPVQVADELDSLPRFAAARESDLEGAGAR